MSLPGLCSCHWLEQLYFYLSAKLYQNIQPCEQIVVKTDCFKLPEIMKPYKDIFMYSDLRECIMFFVKN